MEPIISGDAACRATERLAPDQLTDLHERAALLVVGVESAQAFVAHGEEIPEPLLADLTEYRQITRFLARVSASERQAAHRSHRRKIRRCLASTFNPVLTVQTAEPGEWVA